MLAQIYPDKIVADFSVQSCLWTVGQHYKGDFFFLYNVGSDRPRQHFIAYFPTKTCLCALGQHCTSVSFFAELRLFRQLPDGQVTFTYSLPYNLSCPQNLSGGSIIL